MAQTTFKNIRPGDKFATNTGSLGTVHSLVWIKTNPLRESVEIKTEYGYETHPVSETVFLLHEANRR